MKLSDWSENGSIHATYVCSITSTVRPVRYPFYHANALLYLTLSGIISKKKTNENTYFVISNSGSSRFDFL